MFTWRGEENRPFLNLGKEWGKERYFPKQLWKQPRPWNFGEGAWTEGGPISALFPPLAAFDCLLVYMLLPGSRSRLKVDYKAMKQHYEGRVTPIHFYLIWWLNQGFQWYWAIEGGSLKFLDGIWGDSQYGLWGNSCAHLLLSSAIKPMFFITYWKCPVGPHWLEEAWSEMKQPRWNQNTCLRILRM